MQQTVQVEGMSCAGCAQTVQEKLTNIPTVNKVTVDVENKMASIESEANVSIEDLKEALVDTPYAIAE
jgi:copper chaperone CopZ